MEDTIKGPLSDHGIDGPVYADRVNGRLTYLDWDSWNEDDRREWASDCLREWLKRRDGEHRIDQAVKSMRD